jgi:shikimate kinase
MATQLSAPLRVALVGMSGVGKTFWTRRLAATGCPTVCCDDLIEQRLSAQLVSEGFRGTSGVARWMGWPDSPTYAEREAAYLSAEIATLDQVLRGLEQGTAQELVLDTTGSVIYAGNHLLLRLRRLMTVVYLAASVEEQQLLIHRYLSDPKPVLWHGAFQPKPGETPRETMARCYPPLIESRRRAYEALTHCTIPVAGLHQPSPSVDAFLQKIREELVR